MQKVTLYTRRDIHYLDELQQETAVFRDDKVHSGFKRTHTVMIMTSHRCFSTSYTLSITLKTLHR